MRESQIEAYLVRAVREAGGEAYKFTSPARRGVPDRLCVFPDGSVVFVEVKGPRGLVTPAQGREIRRLLELGQRATVVRSVEEIDRLISEVLA